MKLYDNKGKTIDRYTVIINRDAYTMSENPLSPQGVNMWLCRAEELNTDGSEAIDLREAPIDVLVASIKRFESEIADIESDY